MYILCIFLKYVDITVYTMYIPCIYMVYTMNIHCICSPQAYPLDIPGLEQMGFQVDSMNILSILLAYHYKKRY